MPDFKPAYAAEAETHAAEAQAALSAQVTEYAHAKTETQNDIALIQEQMKAAEKIMTVQMKLHLGISAALAQVKLHHALMVSTESLDRANAAILKKDDTISKLEETIYNLEGEWA
jgi:hypothetical protein